MEFSFCFVFLSMLSWCNCNNRNSQSNSCHVIFDKYHSCMCNQLLRMVFTDREEDSFSMLSHSLKQ